MGTHIPPLRARRGNLIFAADGTVWVNYLLTGINVNSYRTESAGAAQDSHELLLNSLADLGADDVMLSGMRIRVDPLDTCRRVTEGIPDWDPDRYAELGLLLDGFYRDLVTGKRREFDRVFWLSIAYPHRMSLTGRLASSVIDTDPHEDLDWQSLEEFEGRCLSAIPAEFQPHRTTPAAVDWAFERATTRGLWVPQLPPPGESGAVPGESTYPEVVIDTAADSTALYSTFAAEAGKGLSSAVRKPSLWRRFKTLKSGRVMSISHPGRSGADLPDGPSSYQALLGIARYPSGYSTEVSRFTYLVDQAIGVDADFTLRLRFSQSSVEISAVSDSERKLLAEGEANVRDEFEAFDYDNRRAELRRFHDAVRAEAAPRGMQVAAIFAFGSNDIDHLHGRMSAITQSFQSNGFEVLAPVGGQMALWTMMMPGSPRTKLGNDFLQTTTARWFSGAIPIRRSFAGDRVGLPLAVNRENANGQIILLDVLHATDRGNASIALTGAQGGGKSHAMKLILLYLTALKRYSVVVDQSKHGEWAVFARQIAHTQVVDAADGELSMDPLKCLPSPHAETVMMSHYLPLFDLAKTSEEASYLTRVLNPEHRALYGISSTRRLMDFLSRDPGAVSSNLLRHFQRWADLPYTRTFIDAAGGPELPPLENITDYADRLERDEVPHCTVFRTSRLPVYRGSNPGGPTDDLHKWAASVYGTIARLTAQRFDQIRGTCVFFGDEISFLKGNEDVVELLIRSPDRTGRKDQNFVVVASQHADDFDHNYAMIEKKVALRQPVRANAEAALRYLDMPPMESLVQEMQYRLSPVDPDTGVPRPGRQGEGWWNDGARTVRVQFLPIPVAEMARYADTTSSRMIRESDAPHLAELEEAR